MQPTHFAENEGVMVRRFMPHWLYCRGIMSGIANVLEERDEEVAIIVGLVEV